MPKTLSVDLERLLERRAPLTRVGLDAFGSTIRKGLLQIRSRAGPQWPELAAQARETNLAQRFAESPLTRRSLSKPRGYAGDAPMMDYIYRIVGADAGDSSFGDAWLAFEVSCNAATAARYRLRHAARAIDRVLRSHLKPSILALAAGHCRELMFLRDPSRLEKASFTAIDQDELSLKTAADDYDPHVRCIQQSMLEFIRGSDSREYDLIYSLGLFDYLGDATARSVLRKAFDSLRPGGELLIGNYHPGVACSGYMEAMMDWWLIYREEDELGKLASSLPKSAVALSASYCDPIGAVTYLRVVKTSCERGFLV